MRAASAPLVRPGSCRHPGARVERRRQGQGQRTHADDRDGEHDDTGRQGRPVAEAERPDQVRAQTGIAEDLADALLLRWHTLLTASLERGLAGDPEDRKETVIEAWRHATETYRGVRMIIDELAENPTTDGVAHAVHATARNDWAAMAIAAGLASGFDEPAIRVGHRLELEARRRNNIVDGTAVREPPPRQLFSKFKTILIGRSATAGVERRRP